MLYRRHITFIIANLINILRESHRIRQGGRNAKTDLKNIGHVCEGEKAGVGKKLVFLGSKVYRTGMVNKRAQDWPGEVYRGPWNTAIGLETESHMCVNMVHDRGGFKIRRERMEQKSDSGIMRCLHSERR